MDVRTLVDVITNGGGVGILAFWIVASFKGWIVWGREFDREVERRREIEAERNDWRELALRGTNLAESLTEVTERKIFSEK